MTGFLAPPFIISLRAPRQRVLRCSLLPSHISALMTYFLVDLELRWGLIHFFLDDLSLDDRASVHSPATQKPVDHRGKQDQNEEGAGVVHRQGSDWPNSWENEDDADKQCPRTGPDVDCSANLAHMPWTRLELPKNDFAEDGDAVTPVESNSTHIEDASNGSVRAKTDQINSDAPEDGNPYGIKWCSSAFVNNGPDLRKRDQAITGESKNGSRKGLL